MTESQLLIYSNFLEIKFVCNTYVLVSTIYILIIFAHL